MSHYCKICGKYKSNESFSGKGHRKNVCKKCSSKPKKSEIDQKSAKNDAKRIQEFDNFIEKEIKFNSQDRTVFQITEDDLPF